VLCNAPILTFPLLSFFVVDSITKTLKGGPLTTRFSVKIMLDISFD
jgi:hypothetical protein